MPIIHSCPPPGRTADLKIRVTGFYSISFYRNVKIQTTVNDFLTVGSS